MVHGIGGTRWEWVESMAALASSHRVLAPDLIGFGDSPRPDVIYSPAYLGKFLVTFLDAVGIDRATLIGHSLGGRVCLEAAIRAPDAVEGLALIAPLGFGRLSRIGRLVSAGAWWANRLLRRRQPFPRLDVHVEEPDMSIFSGIRMRHPADMGQQGHILPARLLCAGAESDTALQPVRVRGRRTRGPPFSRGAVHVERPGLHRAARVTLGRIAKLNQW